MNIQEFLLSISGSELIIFDEDRELVFVWNGSLTVRIFRLIGEWSIDECDIFTMEEKPESVHDVREQIEHWLNQES